MTTLFNLHHQVMVLGAQSVYKDISERLKVSGVQLPSEMASWENYLRSTLQFEERGVYKVVFVINHDGEQMTNELAVVDFCLAMKQVCYVRPCWGFGSPIMVLRPKEESKTLEDWVPEDWDRDGRVLGYDSKLSSDKRTVKLVVYIAGMTASVLTAIQRLVGTTPCRIKLGQVYVAKDHSPVWVAYREGPNIYHDCFADVGSWYIFNEDWPVTPSESYGPAEAKWRDGWDMFWLLKEKALDPAQLSLTYF